MNITAVGLYAAGCFANMGLSIYLSEFILDFGIVTYMLVNWFRRHTSLYEREMPGWAFDCKVVIPCGCGGK